MKYDSTVDEFQRQCDLQIVGIHEEKLAHERTIVELRAELAEANQLVSDQDSQAIQWWRNEACQERQAREHAQEQARVAEDQARDAEARAKHLQTQYYRLDAEREHYADESLRMQAQLAAANDRATRLSEEMVVMQARMCHPAPADTGGASPEGCRGRLDRAPFHAGR